MNNINAMRHSLAHIAMQALRRLYPDAVPGVGPALEDGFYHDFASSHAVTEDDFSAIEAEMRKIIAEDVPIKKSVMGMAEGQAYLRKLGYRHTLELAENLAREGEKDVSFYTQGEFSNMCKGPHVVSTGKVGAFKLTKIAGAYFCGDASKEMMQRLYGAAFETNEELEQYLKQQEEAKKRDHRKLGKELDLFLFSDLVGPGLPLWTPRGTMLRTLLDAYVWELRSARGFERVEIPHITKKELYETSGHWDKYKSDLFRVSTREGHEYALKPMNCPHHTQIYSHLQRSYRDLPQRYANTTMVYRDEQSGELSGLSRVLCITQDDAHTFCRMSQARDEFLKIWDIIDLFYNTLGFTDIKVRLSFHDPKHPEKYLGDKDVWTRTEDQLRAMAADKKVVAIEAPGEAAFYGPKLDFIVKDSIGREWQVATIQLDMNMPERFDLYCINEQGERERIVMIHAAIMGSIERFLSILIEHCAGAFPVWLSPVQAMIIPVGETHHAFAKQLQAEMRSSGMRPEGDFGDEPLGKRIRAASQQKIPYILVIGDKEARGEDFSLNIRGKQAMLQISKENFFQRIADEIRSRKDV